MSSAPNSLTVPPLAAEYDYPLVTVEIGEFCALLIVCRTTFPFCYRFSINKYHTGPLDYTDSPINVLRFFFVFFLFCENDNITGCKAKFLIEKKKEKEQIVQ